MLLENSLSLGTLRGHEALTNLGDVPSVLSVARIPLAVKYIDVGGEAMAGWFGDDARDGAVVPRRGHAASAHCDGRRQLPPLAAP